MEPDHYTFASFESTGQTLGLAAAWDTTLHLRRQGHKTRLATRQWGRFIVHTVIATPPTRPTRAERGCLVKGEANASTDQHRHEETA